MNSTVMNSTVMNSSVTGGTGGLHFVIAAAHSPPPAPLSGGAIAGIAIASLLGFAVFLTLIASCIRCTRSKKAAAAERVRRGPWSRQAPAELPLPGQLHHSCPLCAVKEYGDIEGGHGQFVADCGHRFHRRCIRRWLQVNSSCPICNRSQFALLQLAHMSAMKVDSPRRFSTSTMGARDPDFATAAPLVRCKSFRL